MQNQSTVSALLGRVGAGAGVFFLWTLFEKQILEPTGLYAYLPFYRVNGVCVWDIAAMGVIFTVFMFAGTRARVAS